MKDCDVDGAAVKLYLRQMGASFRTRQLSELPGLVAEHGLTKPAPGYNAAIGRHLSKNAVDLRIRKDPDHFGSDQVWLKNDHT